MIPVLSGFALLRHHILTVSLQRSLTSCVIVNVFSLGPHSHLISHLISPLHPPPCGSSANRPSHEGKELLKPFFGISLILSRLSCDTDGWQNLMSATSELAVKSSCNLRFRPCSSHLCGSSWPSPCHCLPLFFLFCSVHDCPHKWHLTEISYYDTLSLQSMSIFFGRVSLNQEHCSLKPSIHQPSIQLAALSFCRRSQRSQNNPGKRHIVPLVAVYHKCVLAKIEL